MPPEEKKDAWIIAAVTASVAAAALAVLLWWTTMPSSDEVAMRLAAEQEAFRTARVPTGPEVEIGAIYETFDLAVETGSESWPRFRGARSDNIARTAAPLAPAWPPAGPPVLWRVALGEGYAGPAVHAGRVYVLDYDEALEADLLRCFRLRDGRELWRRGYEVRIKRNHGMSRTVPAVDDEYVVTLGPKCHVMCVTADTGEFRWGIDLVQTWAAKVPLWYAGQCPLIDDGVAVLAPGGSSLLIGVDCATGTVVWETPNPRGWKMSHSSVMPMTIAGRRMYVYCALGGVVGVAADGEDRGRVLWETTAWNQSVVAPAPVAIDGNRILVTAGYGSGSMVLEVTPGPEAFDVSVVDEWDRKVFACEQHTPIAFEGHLFTVMPKDAGELREQLICIRPDGTLAWASGKETRFGLGPFMIVNDRILAMDDDGHLTMARASTSAYDPMADADILDGREAWAPLVLVDGLLLARDFEQLVCLDMR